MINIKLGFIDFQALDNDLTASKRVIPIIVQKVLQDDFRRMRAELRATIPVKSGGIRRHFSFSVRRGLSAVSARLGFIARTNPRTAIAAMVRQHGSNVSAKKASHLWVPIGVNRQASGEPVVSPQEVFADRKEFFVGKSKAGNLIAFQRAGFIPLFVLKKAVRVMARPIPFEERVEQNIPAMNERIENTIKAVIEAKGRAGSL